MRKVKSQDKKIDLLFTILLIVLGIILVYPLWFVVIASFSDPNAVASGQVIFWPVQISFEGYKELLKHPEILIGYRNSIFYLFAGPLISLTLILPASYAVSRRNLKGHRVFNLLFVITMYFSGGVVPTYLLHSTIGWLDTIWVLLIPNAINASYIIIARSAFASIPEAIYESVMLDGGNDFDYFFYMGLPLIKATIAVLFLFSAVYWWNEYMNFVIYIRNPQLQSLQVVLRELTVQLDKLFVESMSAAQLQQVQHVRDLLKYTLVVVAAIPFAIIYPFVQKYFNQGVMIGAVKG